MIKFTIHNCPVFSLYGLKVLHLTRWYRIICDIYLYSLLLIFHKNSEVSSFHYNEKEVTIDSGRFFKIVKAKDKYKKTVPLWTLMMMVKWIV